MCVCQHMWVERCASEELFLFKRVGGILYVFISILENLSGAFESDKGGEKPSEDLKTPARFLHLFYPRCLLYICLFYMTTPSHFAPADCNLLVVTSHLIPQLPRAVKCRFFFFFSLFGVAQQNFLARKCCVLLRSVVNDSTLS